MHICCEEAGANLANGGWSASVSDERARQEGLSEFERRLRECHRLVYQVALGVLRDPADAEEITQDAFLRAYRKLASLREPEKFRAWVARTSFRLALNRRRAAARARQRDTRWMEMRTAAGESVEGIVVQREFEARLQQEIDRLPKKLRSVVLLMGVQELNAQEVAEILGIPEGTVRSRLHLGRKELLRAFCDEAV
jgi:RNA polymerase sigma-70 factor, ECF subfamily